MRAALALAALVLSTGTVLADCYRRADEAALACHAAIEPNQLRDGLIAQKNDCTAEAERARQACESGSAEDLLPSRVNVPMVFNE